MNTDKPLPSEIEEQRALAIQRHESACYARYLRRMHGTQQAMQEHLVQLDQQTRELRRQFHLDQERWHKEQALAFAELDQERAGWHTLRSAVQGVVGPLLTSARQVMREMQQHPTIVARLQAFIRQVEEWENHLPAGDQPPVVDRALACWRSDRRELVRGIRALRKLNGRLEPVWNEMLRVRQLADRRGKEYVEIGRILARERASFRAERQALRSTVTAKETELANCRQQPARPGTVADKQPPDGNLGALRRENQELNELLARYEKDFADASHTLALELAAFEQERANLRQQILALRKHGYGLADEEWVTEEMVSFDAPFPVNDADVVIHRRDQLVLEGLE